MSVPHNAFAHSLNLNLTLFLSLFLSLSAYLCRVVDNSFALAKIHSRLDARAREKETMNDPFTLKLSLQLESA